jgi:hypothetical protein
VGTQPVGVFFIRGQSWRFHCSMRFSSRSMARRSGFWWLHPNRDMNFPRWSGWYRTPKHFLMTSAMRGRVQRSVLYPCASGPLVRCRMSFRSCAADSLGGRPGEKRTSKHLSPCFVRALR